jgi:hypothetical protein
MRFIPSYLLQIARQIAVWQYTSQRFLQLSLDVFCYFNFLFWLIDPFLDNDRETNSKTTFAGKQQILISKNRRSLLGNGSVNTFPEATDTHANIDVLLETWFSTVVRAEEL